MLPDSPAPSDLPPSGIDPDDLATTLRVLGSMAGVDETHPDYIAVRRATAAMFKAVKKERRREIREAIAAADRAVVAATATGAPDRIDDETRGIPISSSTTAPTAGTLLKPRACYICKQPYTVVDAFYHQLCPTCAAMSHAKRNARADLTGKRALLTGGRAKIGMYIALRLLRDGAHTTITTRFPRDAVRRFSSLPDSPEWIDRLKIVGIDLRDPAQVIGLAEDVAAAGTLDILINNATQTVRRSPGAYQPLVDAELAPLPDGPLPELVTFGHTNDRHPQALERSVTAHPILAAAAARADELTEQAMAAGSSSLERLAAGTAIDAGVSSPTSTTPTPGCTASKTWTRSRCSRCSWRTRRRRSCWYRSCARRSRPAPRGAPTWSTSARWRGCSTAATRGRGTLTPIWRRRR